MWSIYSLKDTSLYLFDGAFCVNFATQIFKLAFLLISAVVFLLFQRTAAPDITDSAPVKELAALLIFVMALGCVLISTNNFVILLLALEGVSLALYIMSAMSQTHGGVTAAVKYFAYGTLGSIFLFWGVVHIYIVVPTASYGVLQFLIEGLALAMLQEQSLPLEFATSTILVGFLIKLGAAPLHQ
jgi:NADH:ubiquinone oxidoreductase subunit 2 (subunit N)